MIFESNTLIFFKIISLSSIVPVSVTIVVRYALQTSINLSKVTDICVYPLVRHIINATLAINNMFEDNLLASCTEPSIVGYRHAQIAPQAKVRVNGKNGQLH